MMLLLAASLAFAADTCASGMTISEESLGHCCWPGQAWTGQACAGQPLSCPAGSRVQTWSQSCVSAACPAGQENIDGLHCCWPAQSWSSASETCVGTPTCPPGYGPLGDAGCVQGASASIGGLIGAKGPSRPPLDPARVGSCTSGTQLAADDEHCCLPGDAWSDSRGRCVSPVSWNTSTPAPSSPSGGASASLGQKGEISTASAGVPVVLGALEPELVSAVIKRNMNQIRYCYQRELTKDPNLQGEIVVKFVIAADGSVSQSTTKSTTMNSEAVESCINSRLLRMQFPEPKGGGIVIVTHSFTFVNATP